MLRREHRLSTASATSKQNNRRTFSFGKKLTGPVCFRRIPVHCLFPCNWIPVHFRIKPCWVRDKVVVVNHAGAATGPNDSSHARGIVFHGFEQVQRPLDRRLEELKIAPHVRVRERGCRMIDGVKRGGPLYRRVVCSGCDDIGDDYDRYLRLLRGEVPHNLVAFFLCSNSTADSAAMVKKLG